MSGIRLAFKLAQGGLEIERRKENEKEEMEEGEKEREEREKDEGARDERGRYELKEKAGSLDNLVYLLRVCISLLSLLFHTHWKTVQVSFIFVFVFVGCVLVGCVFVLY